MSTILDPPPPLSNEEQPRQQQPQSPSNEEEEQQQQEYDGIWIGIDLGTSNCAAAVWDSSRQRAKSLRFRNPLAKKASSGKNGRIVPSCLFYSRYDDDDNDDDDGNDGRVMESQQSVVGHEAVQKFEEMNLQMNLETNFEKGVLVTSAKRIWGMTASQIEVELQDDDTFLDSLPFEVRLVSNQDATDKEGARICTGRDARGTSQWMEPMDVATILLRSIRIAAQHFLDGERRRSNGIHPVGVAADDGDDGNDTARVRNCVVGVPAHFGRNQRRAVEEAARNAGFDGHVSTITESTAAALAYGLFVSPVPSTNHLQTIQHDQHDDDNDDDDDENDSSTSTGKTILVFDMGGGTTDVTIATMTNTATHQTHNKDENPVSFRVRATAGDRHLGGDDMDEILFRRIAPALLPSETNEHRNSSQQQQQQQKQQQQLLQDQKHHRANLLQLCRKAKEELCGDGTGEVPPSPVATLEYHGKTIEITREDFDGMIVPLVERARDVVERALDSFHVQNDPDDDDDDGNDNDGNDNDDDPDDGDDDSDKNNNNNTNCPKNKHANTIHEVVLVGGATRTPSIRTMLRSKFPPPTPPDLCHSINAEAAVAQGAAIHAAISSGRVPKHEICSALMLDALPHSIGVLVGSARANDGRGGGEMGTNDDDDDELFVPVLKKDSPLPAMDYVTFTLADVHQKGVTVIAVEDVGDDLPLQRIGEFNFLLHRMTQEEIDFKLQNGKRTVDVGMTVDEDGKFIVSIFDSNDPEHLRKKKRYLSNRTNAVGDDVTGYILHEKGERERAAGSIAKTPVEQIYLTISCMALFLLYVAARLAFHVPEEGAQIL